MSQIAAEKLIEIVKEGVKDPLPSTEKTATTTRLYINLRAFDVAGTKQRLIRAPEFRYQNAEFKR